MKGKKKTANSVIVVKNFEFQYFFYFFFRKMKIYLGMKNVLIFLGDITKLGQFYE